ncbi:hypothetical protein BKA69DRAFT_883753 [Paraphysoderma sedebokerense]|nr:hypothetical protein BKA69DRAFT_883753 [Paraphysoderma sedebokerense]
MRVLQQLAQEESRIDLSVLRHNASDDRERKKQKFQQTVESIHTIVTTKLYKAKTSSLEAYFRSEWKISRAQVYRFLDCALILKDLADFPDQPSRERLCRSLKKLTKSKEDLQKLWALVLERYKPEERDTITSTAIAAIWKELIETGQVSEEPQNGRRQRRKFSLAATSANNFGRQQHRPIGHPPNSHGYEHTSSDEGTHSPPLQSPLNYPLPSHETFVDSAIETSSNSGVSDSEDVDATIQTTLKLIQSLSHRGIMLQPFHQGEWCVGVQHWRLVKVGEECLSPSSHTGSNGTGDSACHGPNVNDFAAGSVKDTTVPFKPDIERIECNDETRPSRMCLPTINSNQTESSPNSFHRHVEDTFGNLPPPLLPPLRSCLKMGQPNVNPKIASPQELPPYSFFQRFYPHLNSKHHFNFQPKLDESPPFNDSPNFQDVFTDDIPPLIPPPLPTSSTHSSKPTPSSSRDQRCYPSSFLSDIHTSLGLHPYQTLSGATSPIKYASPANQHSIFGHGQNKLNQTKSSSLNHLIHGQEIIGPQSYSSLDIQKY